MLSGRSQGRRQPPEVGRPRCPASQALHASDSGACSGHAPSGARSADARAYWARGAGAAAEYKWARAGRGGEPTRHGIVSPRRSCRARRRRQLAAATATTAAAAAAAAAAAGRLSKAAATVIRLVCGSSHQWWAAIYLTCACCSCWRARSEARKPREWSRCCAPNRASNRRGCCCESLCCWPFSTNFHSSPTH